MDSTEDAIDVDLIILYALTCYLLVFRLLKPFVTTLRQQCQDHCGTEKLEQGKSHHRVAISLDSFNLAAKPAMNARITLGLIGSLLEEMHQSIEPILNKDLSGPRPDNSKGVNLESMTHGLNNEAGQVSSSMVDAAEGALQAIKQKEKYVLKRLHGTLTR